jgi:hypothetical protein
VPGMAQNEWRQPLISRRWPRHPLRRLSDLAGDAPEHSQAAWGTYVPSMPGNKTRQRNSPAANTAMHRSIWRRTARSLALRHMIGAHVPALCYLHLHQSKHQMTSGSQWTSSNKIPSTPPWGSLPSQGD